MTGERPQQEKLAGGGTLRILAGFFRWVGIIFFGMFLIAGLVFQAPWKVLVLFAIVLATLTIVPRRARKYIWLLFGVVFVAVAVWAFLPESTSDEWKPYTFDEEITAFEAARSVPDEENAGLIYVQLVESYEPNTYSDDFIDHDTDNVTMCKPWRSEDYPEVASWLARNETLIGALIKVSKKEKYRLNVPYSMVQCGFELDILGPVKSWSQMLIRSANNDLGQGRIDEAFRKYVAVFKIGSHFNQQPTTLSLLIGFAIEQMAVERLKELIVTSGTTSLHLTIIDDILKQSKLSWQSIWPCIIDYEVLLMKNSILSLSYEENSKGQTRITRKPVQVMQSFMNEVSLVTNVDELSEPLTFWQKRILKASAVIAWFVMPSSIEEAGRYVDDAYERFYAMAQPDFEWIEPSDGLTFSTFKMNPSIYFKMFTTLSDSMWYKLHNIFLECETKKQGCRILIYLRKYKDTNGDWPGSLDDIEGTVEGDIFVDPVNGGGFVYNRTDDGFVLYSRGRNGIDESGEKDSETGADDIMFWPVD